MLIGIFGTGRNGSTLIQRLLDGIEGTYVHPVEEVFLTAFNDLVQYQRVLPSTVQNYTNKKIQHLIGELEIDCLDKFYANSLDTLYSSYLQKCNYTKTLQKIFLKDLLINQKYSATDFIREYMKALSKYLRPDIDFKHYLFKSIETPFIDNYYNIFPDMRFIHILRHPVSVCSSQKRSLLENKRLPASYLGYDWLVCMLSKRWIPHAESIINFKEDNRHITVLYENLVSEPIREIGRIAQWLELTPPPRCDIQTFFHDLDIEDIGYNPSKKNVVTPKKVMANLQEKFLYEEILTESEIDLINFKTRKYLPFFGYKESSNPTYTKIVRDAFSFSRKELENCSGVRSMIKGIFGMLYRRAYMMQMNVG